MVVDIADGNLSAKAGGSTVVGVAAAGRYGRSRASNTALAVASTCTSPHGADSNCPMSMVGRQHSGHRLAEQRRGEL
jgi:hypothetical protein